MMPLFLGVGTVLLIVLTIYAIRKGSQEFEKARNALFSQYAEKNGFQFSEVDTFDVQKKIGSMAGFGIAKIPLKNIVYIPTDQGDIYLFDQLKIAGRNASSQRSMFTVCLIETKSTFGTDFTINEAVNATNANITRDMGSIVPGTGFIELGDKAFDDRFIVNGQQPENVKVVLNGDVRKFIFEGANQLSVQLGLQIKGNMLAVHNAASSNRNIEKENDLEVLVNFVKGFPQQPNLSKDL